jgi:hypothetical protein
MRKYAVMSLMYAGGIYINIIEQELSLEEALASCHHTGILWRRALLQSPEKSKVMKPFKATSIHDQFLTLRAEIKGMM